MVCLCITLTTACASIIISNFKVFIKTKQQHLVLTAWDLKFCLLVSNLLCFCVCVCMCTFYGKDRKKTGLLNNLKFILSFVLISPFLFWFLFCMLMIEHSLLRWYWLYHSKVKNSYITPCFFPMSYHSKLAMEYKELFSWT